MDDRPRRGLVATGAIGLGAGEQQHGDHTDDQAAPFNHGVSGV
jgi:hypothetical protein